MMSEVHDLPVLGICGWSGAGKTTLIETVLPKLRRQGLRVAVVKHDAHGVSLDKPGKDSDRFFQAGADVLLEGPQQECLRLHKSGEDHVTGKVKALAGQYDLVLVEGHKSTPLPKIWLESPQPGRSPGHLSGLLDCLPFDSLRPQRLLSFLDAWLPGQWRKAPVYACVLIGGKSRRMGSPKHLLQLGEKTWLEHTVSVLDQASLETVLVGRGDIPASLQVRRRLPDAPDATGPMAGMPSRFADRPWRMVLGQYRNAPQAPRSHGNAFHMRRTRFDEKRVDQPLREPFLLQLMRIGERETDQQRQDTGRGKHDDRETCQDLRLETRPAFHCEVRCSPTRNRRVRAFRDGSGTSGKRSPRAARLSS